MELGSPEWIEASLAKLDNLERQRDDHEEALEASSDPLTLKQHSDAVARLDAEIKSLYAQLEAVADEDDEDEEPEAADAVSPRVTQGDDENSAPHAVAPAAAPSVAPSVPAEAAEPVKAAPVAASPSVATAAVDNPFASPSPATDSFGGGGGGGFDAAPMPFDDSDLKPKGGGGKWAFLAVVVAAGVGVGGYFAWQNMQAQKQDQPKADAGPEQVIKAVAVPEDTEAPKALKGGDATISPNANADGGGGGGGGGGGSKKKVDEKKTKPIKLKVGEDPLG